MSLIHAIDAKYKKPQVVEVRSGDTVKVHQKIREGNKERIQIFEGLVIRTHRKGSHTSSITVRRIASGIGVEKTYLLHSPLVVKVEVTKRSKVRRNYLTYMRARTGKSARLSNVAFDRDAVNTIPDIEVKAEEVAEAAPVAKAKEPSEAAEPEVETAKEEPSEAPKAEEKPTPEPAKKA